MSDKYSRNYFNKTSEKGLNVFGLYKKFIENKGIVVKNLVVCDIGCARGLFIKELMDNNICYGYDISEYAIQECKSKFPQTKERFNVLDLNNNSIASDLKFDMITMFDVIEHLDNFVNFKKIIQNNLKQGGVFILTTPNPTSLQRFIMGKKYTGEIDETHIILFTPYTLDFFLKRVGLKKITLSTPYSFYFKDNFLTKIIPFGGQIFAIYKKC